MRYKGEYGPSELLDPSTNVFHPLAPLIPALAAQPRGAFLFADPKPPPILWSTSAVADADAAMSDDADGKWVDDDASDDDDDDAFPSPPPPSFLDPSSVPLPTVGQVKVMIPGRGFTTFAVRALSLLALPGSPRQLLADRHEVLAVGTNSQASPMRTSDETRQALSELVAALHGPGSEGEGVLVSNALGLVVVAP